MTKQGNNVTNACIPLWALVLLTAGSPGIARAQAAPEEDLRARVAELERQVRALTERLALVPLNGDGHAVHERLDEMDQRLRVTDRKDELRREAEAERLKTAPAVGAGRDGFQLRSGDGSFALRLRGLIHSDGRFFADDEADAAADTFLLRRVRPIVEATMFRKFDLRLMPDFGDGRTVVQDAYLDLRFATGIKVRAGKFKAPFGLERLASAGEIVFTERGFPTSLAPNRDVGLMAYGDVFAGRLSYFAGVFNGVVDGASTDVDDRDGKDVVVRLFGHPFRTAGNERLQGIGIGVAASQGTQRGAAAAPALATYRTSGQQTFFRYLSDGTAAGSVLADGTRRRISAQGYYYAGRLGMLAEQVFSSQEVRRGLAVGDADADAWQLATSWVLTGEKATYRGVSPANDFDPANGRWGAFEATGRYHELSVADGVFPLFASRAASAERAQAGALGLNWYLNRTVKVVFDYEETHFTGGSAAGDRAPAREFLSRLQFSF